MISKMIHQRQRAGCEDTVPVRLSKHAPWFIPQGADRADPQKNITLHLRMVSVDCGFQWLKPFLKKTG